MLVSDPQKRKRSEFLRWIPARVFKVLALGQLLITIPVIALLLLGLSFIGEFKYQGPPLGGFNFYQTFDKSRQAIANYRFPLLRMLGYNPEFEDVYIDIKQEDYRKLEFASWQDLQDRAGTQKANLPFSPAGMRGETKVPAVVRLNGDAVRVKLRLKGDRPLHWRTPDRWSFRVEVKGNKTIFGMKSFSLQRPVVRNYIHEWLFHEVLKREGLIGLRYKFVTLHVNGQSQGVYVVEEHFRKHLIEHNRRREGPILAFAEEVPFNPSDVWTEMPIAPYEAKKWQSKDPHTIARATALIEGFRTGRLKFHEVFDVELWGRYFAVCDLLEAFHGALPKSVKFYYNPVTQRIEPIGFDSHYLDKQYPVLLAEIGDWRDEGGLWGWGAWFQRIFDNNIGDNYQIWEAYVRSLEYLSQPEYLAKLFSDIGEEMERNLDFIYTEFPYADLKTGHPLTGLSPTFFFTPQFLYDRQTFIRARLTAEAGLFAYVEARGASYIDLNVSNRQKLPLEVVEVTLAGRTYRPENKVRLAGRLRESAPVSEIVRLYATPPGVRVTRASTKQTKPQKEKDRVLYKVVGASHTLSRKLYNWYAGVGAEPVKSEIIRIADRYSFVDVDAANGSVSLRSGEWTMDEDLVIPSGFRLSVAPGTTIDLVRGARIVAYGAVQIEGLPTAPIVIRSSDGSGQGLIVINAGAPSSIRHVKFENLSLDEASSWKLTSIVTFYESDVTLENAEFCRNKSEDALNIVRSQFTIRNSAFADVYSDAFDSDFSDGQIKHTRFLNVGNDAIDISGSDVVVSDVRIAHAGDKGLSVGEGARMEAARVQISGGYIGVAVKDQSTLDATDLTIQDSAIGFALYQKKPEFGPASANVWRTRMNGVPDSFWVEQGSTLIFDGSEIQANRTNVYDAISPPEEAPDMAAGVGQCSQRVAQSLH